MKKKKTTTQKLRDNPWIILTIVLGLLSIVLLTGHTIECKNSQEIDLCSVIAGTPAWIVDGKVLGYGFRGNMSVDDLINNKVEFYYSDQCGACHQQIEKFDDWNKYVSSGLVNKCS